MTSARFARPVRTLSLLVLLTAVLTAAAPSLIRIKPGDTLSAIALRHHTTVAVLQALNHMDGSTVIYAGALLKVPGAPQASKPAVAVRRVSQGAYRVRAGDGLIVVARRLHTTPAVLVAANNLHRNYLILGETIRYPVVVFIRPAEASVSGPGLHRSELARQALPDHATIRLMIIAAAKRHGVPPSLALALAWQESGWQQGVVSGVDAIGVMQVLPSTGAALGRLHGRTYNLMLASDNIDAGVTLLRDLLDATGHTERALAGYYQGLGSISRYGVLAETKQYVANILSLRARFQ